MYQFVLSYILFIAEFAYREIFLRRDETAKKIKAGRFDKGSTIFAGVFILVGFWIPLILFIFHGGIPIQNLLITWIGVVSMILGTIIQVIAVKTLGKFYARTLIIQDKHTVIRNGLYKIIRHPGYLGGILVWEGFGLGTGNWLGFLIITALTLSFYLYRITMEEKMLMATFGNEYKDYMKKSYKLLPYLY